MKKNTPVFPINSSEITQKKSVRFSETNEIKIIPNCYDSDSIKSDATRKEDYEHCRYEKSTKDFEEQDPSLQNKPSTSFNLSNIIGIICSRLFSSRTEEELDTTNRGDRKL